MIQEETLELLPIRIGPSLDDDKTFFLCYNIFSNKISSHPLKSNTDITIGIPINLVRLRNL